MKGNAINFKAGQTLTILWLTGVLLTACAPALVQTYPTPKPVLQKTDPILDVQMSSVVSTAKSALASQLQLGADTIQLAAIRQVQWPDGCLGIKQAGMMCAMHVVDGYQITLSANNRSYEIRSNMDGSQIVIVSDTSATPIG